MRPVIHQLERDGISFSAGYARYLLDIDQWSFVELIHLPGKQNPDRSVESTSPMLQRTPVPWPWGGIGLACLFVFRSLAVAAMIKGAWFRNNALFEGRVFGKDHFILAALLGKGSVVMMFMVMLVLSLKCRILMQCGLMLSRVYRDIVGLGLFLGHGVDNGKLKSPL
jgi:hypothetical protein